MRPGKLPADYCVGDALLKPATASKNREIVGFGTSVFVDTHGMPTYNESCGIAVLSLPSRPIPRPTLKNSSF
jgi:hypothetical protein